MAPRYEYQRHLSFGKCRKSNRIVPEIKLCGFLAEQTNIRFMTKTVRARYVKKEEIKKFLGISIIIGNLKFPRLRMYW